MSYDINEVLNRPEVRAWMATKLFLAEAEHSKTVTEVGDHCPTCGREVRTIRPSGQGKA